MPWLVIRFNLRRALDEAGIGAAPHFGGLREVVTLLVVLHQKNYEDPQEGAGCQGRRMAMNSYSQLWSIFIGNKPEWRVGRDADLWHPPFGGGERCG